MDFTIKSGYQVKTLKSQLRSQGLHIDTNHGVEFQRLLDALNLLKMERIITRGDANKAAARFMKKLTRHLKDIDEN